MGNVCDEEFFLGIEVCTPSTLVSVLAAARRNWAVHDIFHLGRFGRRERTLKRASKLAIYSWFTRGCSWNILGKNLVHNLVHN